MKPLLVANPLVRELTFLDSRTRTRRDHMKYLTLIRTLALLHQHQRPVMTATRRGESVSYIEVTREDIALANRLAARVLGRSLDDLSPQTRSFLLQLHRMVADASARLSLEPCDYRFSRKDARAHTGWSDFQVRTHLDKLVSLEHLLVHRGGRGQSFVYELLYDGQGQDGGAFLVGLIDPGSLPEKPSHQYGAKFEHRKTEFEGPLSPHRALIEGGSSGGKTANRPSAAMAISTHCPRSPKPHIWKPRTPHRTQR